MAAHVKTRRGLAPRQVGTWRPVVDRESGDGVGGGGGGTLRKNPELRWQQAAELSRESRLRLGAYQESRLKLGQVLEELKPLYGHGQWLAQLGRWAIDARTAQRAMRDAWEERHPDQKAERIRSEAEKRERRSAMIDVKTTTVSFSDDRSTTATGARSQRGNAVAPNAGCPDETRGDSVAAGETASFETPGRGVGAASPHVSEEHRVRKAVLGGTEEHRSRRAVIGGTATGTTQLHFAELYEAAQAAHALIERLVKAGSLEQIRAMLAVGGGGSQVGGGIPVGAPAAEVAGVVLSSQAAVRTCGSSAALSLSPPPVAPPTGAAGFSARGAPGGGDSGAADLLSPPRVDGAVGNGRAVI